MRLNEDQEMLRQLARDFAAAELAPIANWTAPVIFHLKSSPKWPRLALLL